MRPLLTLLLALAGPIPAIAQEPAGDETNTQAMDRAGEGMDDDRARSHFEAGRNLYAAGAFERAGQEWEEAHRLSGRPELLYNVYVAYRDAGEVRKAAGALRGYLEQADEVQDRVNLEARLASLEEQAAALEVAEAAQTAEAAPDDSAPAGTERGAEPPSPASSEGGAVVPWVMVGVGAAAMAAGAVTGVLALGATSDLEEACPNDLCPAGYDLEGERDDARALVRATDLLWLGGGLLVAGGLLWALFLDGGDEEPVPVGAACSADGCGAVVRGAF